MTLLKMLYSGGDEPVRDAMETFTRVLEIITLCNLQQLTPQPQREIAEALFVVILWHVRG